jgi:hypothetical protein
MHQPLFALAGRGKSTTRTVAPNSIYEITQFLDHLTKPDAAID